MENNITNTYNPTTVSPPGATLNDLIEEKGMTKKDLAVKMGLTLKAVKELLKGKSPLTPEIAAVLDKIFGASDEFWLRREKGYRDFLARKEQRVKLKQKTARGVGSISGTRESVTPIAASHH